MDDRNKQIEQRLRDAIASGDTEQIGQIVDLLRFHFKANYRQCLNLATRVSGISESEWEELLYEADQSEEN